MPCCCGSCGWRSEGQDRCQSHRPPQAIKLEKLRVPPIPCPRLHPGVLDSPRGGVRWGVPAGGLVGGGV